MTPRNTYLSDVVNFYQDFSLRRLRNWHILDSSYLVAFGDKRTHIGCHVGSRLCLIEARELLS